MCKTCQTLRKQFIRSERRRRAAVAGWRTAISEYEEMADAANAAIRELRAQLTRKDAELRGPRNHPSR